MAHFTYSDPPDMGTLNQGDVLAKTDEIKDILEDVHSYYKKDDYQYFIVITQSCDLVRRAGELCKAPYITLAAVRPFELLLKRTVGQHQKSPLESKGGLVNANIKPKLTQFLERLLNNNEHEFFYLHEDHSINFPQSVAFLRLSIAIKSRLHYDTCLKAKRLQLNAGFQAKLGWLIGNMYSRVGTEDWVPDTLNEEAFRGYIEETLAKNFVWVDDKKLKELKNIFADKDVTTLEAEEILETLRGITILTRKEKLIERLQAIITDGAYMDAKKRESLIRNIKNDSLLGQLLK